MDRTVGAPNSKLHTDALGMRMRTLRTGGQARDRVGTRAMDGGVPHTGAPLADRDNGADWDRNVAIDAGASSCIPSRECPRTPFPYDAELCTRCLGIENSFARLKDWRGVAPPA